MTQREVGQIIAGTPCLNIPSRSIIKQRLAGRTLSAIAHKRGCTKENIRLYEKRAVKMLAEMLGAG